MTKTYVLDDGKKVKVTAKNKRITKKFHGQEHYTYTITIEMEGVDAMLKTSYHDSIHNYNMNKGATKEMIDDAVYCIVLDADSYLNARDYYDFINEFGYEDNAEGKRVYKACKATYDALYGMMSEAQVDSLYDKVHKD